MRNIKHAGFTLIEILLVLAIIGIAFGLVGTRLGTFNYWKSETAIKDLTSTIVYLHHQAKADQTRYRLDLNLKSNSYQVSAIKEELDEEDSAILTSDMGRLTFELEQFLVPIENDNYTLIPPPSKPSLAMPKYLPEELRITDIYTASGKTGQDNQDSAFISFSSRGFSDFAVIHLEKLHGGAVTLLVNPFTGNVDRYNEYREFEWTYGHKKD